LIRTALITLAVTVGVGVGVWWLGRCFSMAPATPADLMGGLAIGGMGAAGIWVVLVIWQGIHESRVIRQVVANALRGRAPLSDEEFGSRFYGPLLAPVASRVRRLLAEHLGCDLAGLIPTADFEQWLPLSSGPDSAADTFLEEVAIEFRLTRWPDGLGSFDALVRFVAEQAPASRQPGSSVLPC